MNLTNPRRNEIFMAEMLFSNLERSERPIIILSKNRYNENSDDVIVCGITTNSAHPLHLIINEKDLQDGKLVSESGARADMLARLLKTNLKFRIGKITDEYHGRLFDKIGELIK